MFKNISMIVAMTKKTNAIGRKNDMLYHLPEDLKYFKQTTSGHTIVVGYNTYMSFPKRPLPNRKNIVLTRKDRVLEGAEIFHSVEDVLNYAKKNPEEQIFIAGGDTIYKQFMEYASKLFVTLIDENETVDAEAYFPKIDEKVWEKIQERNGENSSNKTPDYCFTVWERR